ncbi:MAG TPA: type II toxin-antitoxin system VapC family toxin [Thermoanaerobaculia bacterium]|nr:type II toxin-antitoxin system VapC family toxin [Thermoanaerobaculia bacterium]
MKILLDTHCWLWMQAKPQRLSQQTRALLQDPGNQLYLSAASSWEIAIKYALGKLPLPLPPVEYVLSRMETSGTSPLPVQHSHALHAGSLPLHHADPFDRLLIAQAQLENMELLTADGQFEAYEVNLLWA